MNSAIRESRRSFYAGLSGNRGPCHWNSDLTRPRSVFAVRRVSARLCWSFTTAHLRAAVVHETTTRNGEMNGFVSQDEAGARAYWIFAAALVAVVLEPELEVTRMSPIRYAVSNSTTIASRTAPSARTPTRGRRGRSIACMKSPPTFAYSQ